MHSQNCTFLPSKKKSAFNNSSLPNNIEIFRNFSSHAFSTVHSSSNTIGSVKATLKDLNPDQHSSRPTGIMDYVYSFSDSSRMNLRKTLSNGTIPTEKLKYNCKDIFSQYNTVTQMPLLTTHLVGGFVGSKSQLGRRPAHGFGVNMWDIIRELVGVMGNSSANFIEKQVAEKNSFSSKKSCSAVKENKRIDKNMKMNNNIIYRPTKLKDTNNSQKQSYADVAKIKLGLPSEISSGDLSIKTDGQNNIERDSGSVLKNLLVCSESENRNRITSECSLDSEDSFILFDYCEGDDISIVDDECSSSDDDSVVDFEITNKEFKESWTDIERRTEETLGPKNNNPSKKQVKFAEGKDLAKVHLMIKWTYAYRAARRGPWEMLARDSERFRRRIIMAESILLPILEPTHREAVFQQRFAP